MNPAQPGPPAGAAEHAPRRVRCPRPAVARPGKLDQQHPAASRRARVLAGHVLEVRVDHRRADPPDQAAVHHPVHQVPRMLGLGACLVRVGVTVADVRMRGARLGAVRVLPQVQVRQVQPARLTDRNPPSYSQVTTMRSRAVAATSSSRPRASSGSIFGCRRTFRRGASGLAGISVFTCPSSARFRSAFDGSRTRHSRLPSSVLRSSSARPR
jgi:hypothetical protein